MACPFFLPASPVAAFSDLYDGECAAEPCCQVTDGDTLRCCNHGYARNTCDRAAQAEADAFRFMIKADRDGIINVAWSSERNHHPVAVGTLAIDLDAEIARQPLEMQARAYAQAYREHTGPQ